MSQTDRTTSTKVTSMEDRRATMLPPSVHESWKPLPGHEDTENPQGRRDNTTDISTRTNFALVDTDGYDDNWGGFQSDKKHRKNDEPTTPTSRVGRFNFLPSRRGSAGKSQPSGMDTMGSEAPVGTIKSFFSRKPSSGQKTEISDPGSSDAASQSSPEQNRGLGKLRKH